MIFSIPEEYEGKTVLFFLKQHLSLSRGIIISLKNKPDGILQNGKHVTVRALLSCGDELALMLEDTEDDINEAVEPVCLPVEILYEDEDIIAVNKPGGMATHPSHNHHGDTLANALTYYFAGRPFVFRAAGRLDRDVTGLLILTNDGALIHGIISPGRHVPKVYFAELDAPLPPDAADRLAEGITLDDGFVCLPAELCYEPGRLQAKITVHEGKFHQVKRMFAALGSDVTALRRLSVGPVELGDIPEGEFRELTEKELSALRQAAGCGG